LMAKTPVKADQNAFPKSIIPHRVYGLLRVARWFKCIKNDRF
jgi:hypothetical protein